MRLLPTAPACAALMLFSACTSADSNEVCGDTIVTRSAPGVDFSTIQTFAVLSEADYPDELPSDLPADTKTSLDAANTAARAELLALGLSEVDPDTEDPDVWVFSLAASETESGTIWQCVPGYVWWGWYWFWDPCAWLEAVPINYEVGSVLVGLADAESEQAVFGGAVQGVLECESPRERLTLGVEKIFADYPG